MGRSSEAVTLSNRKRAFLDDCRDTQPCSCEGVGSGAMIEGREDEPAARFFAADTPAPPMLTAVLVSHAMLRLAALEHALGKRLRERHRAHC